MNKVENHNTVRNDTVGKSVGVIAIKNKIWIVKKNLGCISRIKYVAEPQYNRLWDLTIPALCLI